MKHKNKLVVRYLRQIKRRLPIFRLNRKRLLEGLTNELSDYILEHKNATYADLISIFGIPDVVAESVLENAELNLHTASLFWKRFIWCLTAAMVILVIFLGIKVLVMMAETQVEVIETIVVYDERLSSTDTGDFPESN